VAGGKVSDATPAGAAATTVMERSIQKSANVKDVLDFQTGVMDFIVFGKISYEDIFGVKHETRFCLVTGNDRVGVLIPYLGHHQCSRYNHEDTNSAISISALSPVTAKGDIQDIVCMSPGSTPKMRP
jgi:hypothetical protein